MVILYHANPSLYHNICKSFPNALEVLFIHNYCIGWHDFKLRQTRSRLKAAFNNDA